MATLELEASLAEGSRRGRRDEVTAFSIPPVVTARLRLRAFHAGNLDACSDTRQPRSDAPSADRPF